MFLCEALGCLHSHYATPGCKETPHLQIQNTTDREINHTTNGCCDWWETAALWSYARWPEEPVQKGAKWAIIWHSAVFRPKRASSFFLTRRSEGREAPHLLLLMVQLQVVPHPPSWPLRCGFPPLLIIPTSSWEDIFPHCNQKESWFFLAWLCPLSSQRYPEAPWVWRRGTVRGGKGLTVPRDSPSLPHNR